MSRRARERRDRRDPIPDFDDTAEIARMLGVSLAAHCAAPAWRRSSMSKI